MDFHSIDLYGVSVARKIPFRDCELFSLENESGSGKTVYTLYEGKIIYNGMEYESEIDGYSGVIRGWEAEAVKR